MKKKSKRQTFFLPSLSFNDLLLRFFALRGEDSRWPRRGNTWKVTSLLPLFNAIVQVEDVDSTSAQEMMDETGEEVTLRAADAIATAAVVTAFHFPLLN